MNCKAQYTVGQLQAVQGALIVGAVVGDAGFPSILVEHVDGRQFWLDVQADAEGNGPGYVHVEAVEREEVTS